MIFYLVLADTVSADINDHYILGEISFKTFHAGAAWYTLQKLIDEGNTIVLEALNIIDSTNTKWEMESFLTFLSDYKIVKY